MVDVILSYSNVVNFAMQQNHVPIVRSLVVKNLSNSELNNIKVKISIGLDLTEEIENLIDCIPAQSNVEAGIVKLSLSPKQLSELTERISTEILIKIIHDEQEIFSKSYPIDVLAFDQWSGTSVLPEILASFVTPNHPETAKIIKRASVILEQWTGNPSFDEYQSRNPDRVKKQIAALYEAIAEMEITYCSVPASFEDSGQRIRMLDTISNTRIGNCIDMSLLFASCLESVGINPLIVLLNGHAFAGAWLVNSTFADSINDDASLLVNRTFDGINEIILVESTCMNAGQNVPFDKAVIEANSKIKDVSNFIMFLDVKRSRFGGIRPLPQRISSENGIEIIEDQAFDRENIVPESISIVSDYNSPQNTELTKQRLWERKLLDLSLRNNLLNTRITKNTLQLMSVEINLLEDALANGDEFQILPKPKDWANDLMDAGLYQALNQSDPLIDLIKQELSQKRLHSFLSDTELTRALTYLYRASRLSIEENGANTLYLALGFLRWYETPTSEKPRFAPILLLPVEIIRKSAQKGYIIRSREEDMMMNITLLEMLRQLFEIDITGLETLPRDEHGIDLKTAFNVIRKHIIGQKRWSVEEQTILGVFSFNKFIMWNDIHTNVDKLSKNKIVKSLISGLLEWEVEDIKAFDNLDSQFKPEDIALPISADSSQLEAVCAAASDKSFILHGPPGTGKSQTITNIIANALYNGKKVLFVAEKMAALSVVQNRLAKIGLAPFCLELHSNKSKKSTILEQLKRTSEIHKNKSPEAFHAESERIHTLRHELNDYVETLHKQTESGYSLYDAISGYLNLEAVKNANFEFDSNFVKSLWPERVAEYHDLIDDLQSAAELCKTINNHPLSDIHCTNYLQTLKSETRELLTVYLSALKKLGINTETFLNIFGENISCSKFHQYETLSEIATFLLEKNNLFINILETGEIDSQINAINEIILHGTKRDENRSALLADFTGEILKTDAQQLLDQWAIAENKWFLVKNSRQRKIKKSLKSLFKGRKFDKHKIVQYLTLILDYQKEQTYLEKNSEAISRLFQKRFVDFECDWSAAKQDSDNTLKIHNLFNKLINNPSEIRKIELTFASRLASGIEYFLTLYQSILNDYVNIFNEQKKLFDLCSSKLEIEEQSDTENWLTLRTEKAQLWLQNIEYLKDWCAWNTSLKNADDNGLSKFCSLIIDGSIQIDEISKAFDKALFKGIINETIDSKTVLSSFSGKLFEDKIKKFKLLLKEFEKLTQEELFAKLASQIPSFVQEASQSSEVGILQRNIRNNGRGTSIRKLFDSIPNLLIRMAPCMLMSPMSVAQYIDPDNFKFDLVVFDEASQMPTCEAVGAIARGHNLVVVGDPKQMPPTNFFTTNTVDEENIDTEDLESILDDCLALSMPSKHLLWHYRSKHESLITFSNTQYYENKLLTFPSPDDIKSKVSLVKIDGYYDKGKSRQNKAEAQAVIDEIFKRLNDPVLSKRSIGVVTFSLVQQILIEDMLNEAFSKNPKLEAIALESEEPIFIKNLENVQGDERDVILFSVGYGPDKDGRVSLNFGPLNRDGGWRRLNVAVTRARYEMIIFSTLKADQINLSRTSSEGVAGLKTFLEYAEKGKQAIVYQASKQASHKDNLVNIIADEIRAKGFDIQTNIGCSGYRVDIGVVNPDKPDEYILGILCDGYNYKTAKTARDREMIQQDVLQLLGWNIQRVWSLDWWENKDRVMNRLLDAIKNPGKKAETNDSVEVVKKENFASQSAVQNPKSASKEVEEKQVEKIAYQKTVLANQGNGYEEFLLPEKFNIIVKQINQIIDFEAPVSKEQICRRIFESWKISRSSNKIEAIFNKIFASQNFRTTQAEETTFYWRKTDDINNMQFYRVGMTPAIDIAPEEVSVVVRQIVSTQISLPKDVLLKETARLFGFSRSGNIVDASMNRGVAKAVELGFVKEENGKVFL